MPARVSKWNVKWAVGYIDVTNVKWEELDSQCYFLCSYRNYRPLLFLLEMDGCSHLEDRNV